MLLNIAGRHYYQPLLPLYHRHLSPLHHPLGVGLLVVPPPPPPQNRAPSTRSFSFVVSSIGLFCFSLRSAPHVMYPCLLCGLLAHIWLLIGWFSNPRDEVQTADGTATVVASGGSLTHSLNQSINPSTRRVGGDCSFSLLLCCC